MSMRFFHRFFSLKISFNIFHAILNEMIIGNSNLESMTFSFLETIDVSNNSIPKYSKIKYFQKMEM